VTLANGQNITIEVGKTTGTVTTTAPNDALNGHAPLTNAITGVSGGNYENLVADKTPVSTTVTDTVDTTNLSLSATNSVAEGGSIVYTATLTNAAGSPVTVTLSNGSVITIEAGKTTGTVTVPAPADDVYKDAGKVEVTIKDARRQLRKPGTEHRSGRDRSHRHHRHLDRQTDRDRVRG
jgi:surface adhesion protein